MKILLLIIILVFSFLAYSVSSDNSYNIIIKDRIKVMGHNGVIFEYKNKQFMAIENMTATRMDK